MMRVLAWTTNGLAMLSVAALLGAGGCNKSDSGKGKDAAAPANKAADQGKAPADGAKDGAKKDAHVEKGPHGGSLAEWGEEKYHAEFTVDHGKKTATVYILDGEAKKATPIAAESITLSLSNVKPPVQVTLKAAPQADDPKGQASRFTGTHDQLAKEMEFEGEISGKVGDTPYAGKFKEKDHDDHKKK
ncbi:MAG: hypothetical protein K2X38_22060 [Gemmataceae bacterium]|nr:hypothetical protein [Gemmataceae bacterium]